MQRTKTISIDVSDASLRIAFEPSPTGAPEDIAVRYIPARGETVSLGMLTLAAVCGGKGQLSVAQAQAFLLACRDAILAADAGIG